MTLPRTTARLFLLTAAALAGVLGVAAWFWFERSLAQTSAGDNSAAPPPHLLEQVGTVPDELHESSGVAVSRTQPGVLWSHNDSGDGPFVYAIDLSGRLLARIRLAGVDARDWEDMAAGPCPPSLRRAPAGSPMSCLYIGDIGDNREVRDVLTVHTIVEPLIGSLRADPPSVEAHSFSFRYPDGSHDSEALAVLPNGDVVVLSKGRSGRIGAYGLSGANIADAIASGEVLTAEHHGDLSIDADPGVARYVTGAAISPDGVTMAVRTYNEVFFFEALPAGDLAGLRWHNLQRSCFLNYAEPQGEAIDYLDEDTLVLTSERGLLRPGPIHRLQC